jgi:hypothetical protein
MDLLGIRLGIDLGVAMSGLILEWLVTVAAQLRMDNGLDLSGVVWARYE